MSKPICIFQNEPHEPYDYQQSALKAIFDFFYAGKKGNPLVVAPTGSGKSVIISEFCRIVRSRWEGQKVLVISDTMEILYQNYMAIVRQCDEEIGLYSSGLKTREIQDITVAGIQTIYNKPELFNGFDIILVDECHKISPNVKSRYALFFKCVKKPVIGFTATPYRLGTGYLHLGKKAIFADIVYTIRIKELQDKKRLCLLTNKQPGFTLDASNIKKQAGDFIIKELSMAFDRKEITKEIVQDLVKYKELRKKWLLFAIDIEHCEHIAEELNSIGIKTAAVHSKMTVDRQAIIRMYKEGMFQCLVSVAVLTTGFDDREIDLIGLLRSTASPVLHVQMIGRGLRYWAGKKDCLVLDYAQNLKRNGPIDSPVIKLVGKGGGEAIMKVCDNCQEIVHIAVRVCPNCQATFQFKHNLSTRNSNAAIVSLENWHEVNSVDYESYTGTKGIAMLKVNYNCGLRHFHEMVCVMHPGKPRYFAKFWWETRSDINLPNTVQGALANCKTLKEPVKILVSEKGKYPEIKDRFF